MLLNAMTALAGGGVALVPTALGERWYKLAKQLKLLAMARELALQAECVAIDEQSQPLRFTLMANWGTPP